MLDFVSININNKLYDELKSPSVEYQHLFSVGDLTVGFECLETIAMKRNNGWLNDEARNIFMDSVNLLNGFRKDCLPSSPPIYAVNAFGITPLHKYAKSSSSHYNCLEIHDKSFSRKLKNFIVNYPMRSTLANVLFSYRKEDTMKLSRFYANLHVRKNHYVSVFIDIDKRTVHTCDSLQNNTEKTTKAVTLLRKWIAKSMSIIDHYLGNNVKGRLISFDSSDMCISDSYDPSHESNFPPNTTDYMYYHKEISSDNNFPIQHDGSNCGVYSLWYLLLDIYKDKSNVTLDPNRFRNQLLLYMVSLYMYRKRVEDKGYHFRKNWDWYFFFAQKYNTFEVNILFKNIFDKALDNETEKDKDGVTGIKEWQIEFNKIYHNNSSYFSITSLSKLLSEEFPDILHELADNISAEVEFHVHWNLDTKSKKRDFFRKK